MYGNNSPYYGIGDTFLCSQTNIFIVLLSLQWTNTRIEWQVCILPFVLSVHKKWQISECSKRFPLWFSKHFHRTVPVFAFVASYLVFSVQCSWQTCRRVGSVDRPPSSAHKVILAIPLPIMSALSLDSFSPHEMTVPCRGVHYNESWL